MLLKVVKFNAVLLKNEGGGGEQRYKNNVEYVEQDIGSEFQNISPNAKCELKKITTLNLRNNEKE